jgi:hypothetical protein
MQTTVQGNSTSNAALWGGRIMSGLMIAFMLLDGGMKLVPLDAVILTSKQMGIPSDLARPLGVIGLVCTLLSGSISACWSGVGSTFVIVGYAP